MSEKKARSSRWLYGLAIMVPMLGCLIAMVLVYQWFPGLPGTFGAKLNLDNLTQVVVPGSEEIVFSESGAHAVYYEYRSVVDGVVYASSEEPPALACTLTSRATGAEVGAVPDYVRTNTYTTKDRERVGVLLQSITIDQPGAYTFSCRYADGRAEPQVVLAVGPNFVWEFFGIAARTVLTVVAGLAALLGSGIVAALIVLAIAVRRRRSPQADEHRQRSHRGLAAWIAALAALGTIVLAEFLPRGDSAFLRGAGVGLLALAAVLIFAPFFLLRKHGRVEDGGTYMQTRAVVDRGLYALIRHPQYLGYMLLACGFALLSQHWLVMVLGLVAVAALYFQGVEEERTCLNRLGAAYGQYMQRVPRFNLVLGIFRKLSSSMQEA